MEKDLLIRVLSTNNRVVIPSFGAFLRKQQSDALVFSPFLKSDDGFLASVVRDEYGVSDDDARQMVAAFAEHIASVLRARSKFYIDGVGTLVVDDNGAVSFIMDTTRQIPPSPSTPPYQEPVQPPVQVIEPQPIAAQPITQPIAPQPIQPQPIAPQPIARPVAPQPISAAARTTYVPPVAPPSVPQPVQQPMQAPTRPSIPAPAPPRPISPGGFTRPAPMVPPIAQQQQQQSQQPQQQPIQQQPIQPQSIQQQVPKSQQQQPQPQSPQQPQQPQRPQQQGSNPRMQNGPAMNRPSGGNNGQGYRRPAARKKGKNDVWLVVAIIAALVVIVLMVIGILTANEMGSFQL